MSFIMKKSAYRVKHSTHTKNYISEIILSLFFHMILLGDDIIFSFICDNYFFSKDTFNYIVDNRLFISSNNKLYFVEELNNLEQIDLLNNYKVNFNDYYNIVSTKYGDYKILYKNKYYVVLEYKEFSLDLYQLIIEDKKKVVSSGKIDWRDKWINRSEYIMNTYYSYRNKNKVIDNSIDYYFGLLESSICYLNEFNYENVNLYVQHAKMSYFDYFNPFNIRIDVKERDFSNFLKYIFFDDKYNESYVRSIIEKNINNYDFNLVVARLIYPDYYFDLFDEYLISSDDKTLDLIKKIVNRVDEYEKYVYMICNYVKLNIQIKNVDYLNLR